MTTREDAVANIQKNPLSQRGKGCLSAKKAIPEVKISQNCTKLLSFGNHYMPFKSASLSATDFHLPKAVADFFIRVRRVLATITNDTFLAKAPFFRFGFRFFLLVQLSCSDLGTMRSLCTNKDRQAHDQITNYYFGCSLCVYHASLSCQRKDRQAHLVRSAYNMLINQKQ